MKNIIFYMLVCLLFLYGCGSGGDDIFVNDGTQNRIITSTRISDSSDQTISPPIDLVANPIFNIDFLISETQFSNVSLSYGNTLVSINCGSSFSALSGCLDRGRITCEVRDSSFGQSLFCEHLESRTSGTVAIDSLDNIPLELRATDFTRNPIEPSEDRVSFAISLNENPNNDVLGQISGQVVDAESGLPLDNVRVEVYQGTQLVDSSQTNASGSYAFELPIGSGYRLDFLGDGLLPASLFNLAVSQNEELFIETVRAISRQQVDTGNVGGTVIDALTGAGVSGLNISLRIGINSYDGAILHTTTTSSTGSYTFTNLGAGYYTAEISGSGFSRSYFTLICIGGINLDDQTATIAPVLASGETRIVLTWGVTPSDLDSHLIGPDGTGGQFHVYFAEDQHPFTGNPRVSLDLDDVNSFGPETITIHQQVAGTYRYSVHDFSNGSNFNSLALSNSGAQVRVYRGEGLVATYNVPTNRTGTVWTVFELNGSTLTPVNSITNNYPSIN